MTVEVFDSLASSQGLQKSGWFAKIVKDKFNIKLNIIAPNVSGGDTVFDTRSASGNLGDLVIVGTGNGRLNKLVKAKLIEDMTPYYSSMKNVKKYDSAVKSIAKQAGKDGVWGCSSGCLLPVSDRPERRQRVGCRTVHPLGYLQGDRLPADQGSRRSAQCA